MRGELTTNSRPSRLTREHTLKQRAGRVRNPTIRAFSLNPVRVDGVARRHLHAVARVVDAWEIARGAGDGRRGAVAVRHGGAHCAVCCVDEGGAGGAGWG
jgi:hypothetical protein